MFRATVKIHGQEMFYVESSSAAQAALKAAEMLADLPDADTAEIEVSER